jgi:transposase
MASIYGQFVHIRKKAIKKCVKCNLGLGQIKYFFYSSCVNTNDLPDDIHLLKDLVLKQQADVEKLKLKNEDLNSKNQLLEEALAMYLRQRFGRKSEQVSKEQLGLFNEVESIEPKDNDDITVPAHKRRGRGKRLKIPEHLPRVEEVLDLDYKQCPHDGTVLKRIGEETSERLEIIPAKFKVIKTIRPKYVCPCCESFHIKAVEPKLIPKSNASASLLAFIAMAKYADALPLYRQEAQLARFGVELPRQTMARWMIKVGAKIAPLIKLLRQDLLANSSYIHMDETTVQVINEDGKRADQKSYMWIQARAGPHGIVLFHYAKDRRQTHPVELLGDYGGALQVDGYDGYNAAIKNNGIMRLGCWAHARRKFFDAFKSSSGKSIGKQGLVFFKKLYAIEDQICEKSYAERFFIRLQQSMPIVRELEKWKNEQMLKVTPSSLAGKALTYLNNEWQYLVNCFCSGEYALDNNFAERNIRPFTIGRKNWLFSVKAEGATASANIYSLIKTAKINGLEPFAYLNELFEKLPLAQNEDDLRALLPTDIRL